MRYYSACFYLNENGTFRLTLRDGSTVRAFLYGAMRNLREPSIASRISAPASTIPAGLSVPKPATPPKGSAWNNSASIT